MKQTLLSYFLLISVISFAQDNDVEQVKKTFSSYKKSILEGNGAEAVKWVDNKTLTYYDKILNASINADSAEVQSLAIIDKLTVFTVRHTVPKNEITGMLGKEFFVYSINKGMVGKNSVMTIEIGEVKINGNVADGQLVANGQAAPLYFQFNKEDNLWKLDITSVFPATNAGLKKMISGNGMSENEFIFKTLEMTSGKPPGNEIWQPLK